jgi:hypothetical protein
MGSVRTTHRKALRRLCAVIATLTAALAPAPAARADAVPVRSAADFRDSISVNVHAGYYDTAYGDWAKIVAKLDDLGVDHLRDGTYANPGWGEWNERYYGKVELAAAHGKRFDFIMGEPNYAGGSLDQLIALVSGRLRGAVDSLEGPNEYDLFHGGPNWSAELREYQRELYRKVKAEPRLADVPVIGPSVVFGDSKEKLGRLDDSLDAGNIHPYTGGEAPSPSHLSREVAGAGRVSGGKPVLATEAGFHNALAAQQGQPPVSEEVAASYVLRTYLEHFRAGIDRTYLYELIDEKPDAAMLEPEQHFGLLRNDFSEKPAFTALRRMLHQLGRPGRVTPRPLAIPLEGDTDDVQQLLLQRSERRYTLVLWQAQSEWDPKLRRPLLVPERQVSLALPAPAEASVGRPARSGDVTAPVRTDRLEVGIPADPLLVDLEFATPPPLPPPPVAPSPPEAARPVPPSAEAPAPACPAAGATGGRILRAAGVDARIESVAGRRNSIQVELCSAQSGRAVLELRPAGSGARAARLLASRKLRERAGRTQTVRVAWAKRAGSARAAARSILVRVRHRPDGATQDVVLQGRIRVRAAPRRR